MLNVSCFSVLSLSFKILGSNPAALIADNIIGFIYIFYVISYVKSNLMYVSPDFFILTNVFLILHHMFQEDFSMADL